MTLAQRYLFLLKFARDFSERLLADFKTPQQWVHQAVPGTNHALWFIGHMANTDNYIIGGIAPDKKKDLAFAPKFGMGSQPSTNPADYPPAEEILSVFRERRQTLMSLVEKLSDADLSKPIEKAPPGITDTGLLLGFCAYHEGEHAGQITVVRRSLGFKLILEVPPPKTSA